MALSDLDLEVKLRALIKTNEEFLQKRLEGGDITNIRRDDFATTDYKGEELVNPPGGIYNAQKNLEEWMKANSPAPGEDADKIKKKMWRQFSKEMSSEISKNIVDWLNKDIVPGLASEINNQIKTLDIKLFIPPGMIYCGPYPNAAPIILQGGAGIPEAPDPDADPPDLDPTLTVDFEIT